MAIRSKQILLSITLVLLIGAAFIFYISVADRTSADGGLNSGVQTLERPEFERAEESQLGGGSGKTLGSARTHYDGTTVEAAIDFTAEIAKLIDSNTAFTRESALFDLFRRWGNLNAQSALKYIVGMGSPDLRRDATQAVVFGWAETNSEKAARWLESTAKSQYLDYGFANDRNPLNLFDDVFLAIASRDIGDQINLLENLGQPKSREVAILRLALSAENSEASLEIAKAILAIGDNEEERAELIEYYAWEWASRDPQGVAAFISTAPSYTTEGLVSSMAIWADVDPVAAMTWITNNYLETAGGKYVARVHSRWVVKDREKASRWLSENSLPDSTYDLTVKSMVSQVVDSDPDDAITWSRTINSGEMYRRTAAIIYRSLLERSSEEADAYLRESGVTGGEIASISKRD